MHSHWVCVSVLGGSWLFWRTSGSDSKNQTWFLSGSGFLDQNCQLTAG
jgi:hypothetical protein